MKIDEDKMAFNIMAAVFGRTAANLVEEGYFGRNPDGTPVYQVIYHKCLSF